MWIISFDSAHPQCYVRQLLQWRFGRNQVRLRQLAPKDLEGFVTSRVPELTRGSTHALTVGLRGFLRFLEFSGRIHMSLSAAVPHPPPLPLHQPPKTLEWQECQRFLRGFFPGDSRWAAGLRNRPQFVSAALRSQEVAALTLDDLNWRTMTLQLRQTKQRRERRLPMPDQVAKALAIYLTRDLQFLITDGKTFFHEERRDLDHLTEMPEKECAAFPAH